MARGKGSDFACAATLLAALWFSGCGDSAPPLPPDIVLDGLPAAVEKAISAAVAAAKENKNDPEVLLKLGYTLQAHSQYAPAADAYARAAHFRPSFEAFYARGLALEALNRREEAIAAFTEALKLKPAYQPAHLRLGELQLASNQPTLAMAEFRVVLDTDPSNPRARAGLGRVFRSQKKDDAANTEFNRALEVFPAYGPVHQELGQFYQRKGVAELANFHLEKYREFALVEPAIEDEMQDKILAYNQGSYALVREAARSVEIGNLAKAVATLEQAVKLDPNNVQAHLNLLTLYAKDRRFIEAEQHFRRAVQLAPNRADAYYGYGVMRFTEQRYQESCAAFKKAIDLNPKYAEALTNFAFCEENDKRPEQAMALFQRAREAKPSYRPATFHYARMLAMNNRINEAIPLFEAVQNPVDRDTPAFAMALGTAYYQAKRTADARRQWEKAVSLAQSLNQPGVEAQAKAMLAKFR